MQIATWLATVAIASTSLTSFFLYSLSLLAFGLIILGLRTFSGPLTRRKYKTLRITAKLTNTMLLRPTFILSCYFIVASTLFPHFLPFPAWSSTGLRAVRHINAFPSQASRTFSATYSGEFISAIIMMFAVAFVFSAAMHPFSSIRKYASIKYKENQKPLPGFGGVKSRIPSGADAGSTNPATTVIHSKFFAFLILILSVSISWAMDAPDVDGKYSADFFSELVDLKKYPGSMSIWLAMILCIYAFATALQRSESIKVWRRLNIARRGPHYNRQLLVSSSL